MAELLSEMQFEPGILNEAAGQMPKYVYLAQQFSNTAACIGIVLFLWYLKEVFRNIRKSDTPFIKENTRAIFRMGIAVMIFLAARENLFLSLLLSRGSEPRDLMFSTYPGLSPVLFFSAFPQSLNMAGSYSRNRTRHCEVKGYVDYFTA